MFPVGYARRHWKGQLSLPVSYWVNGPLLWIGLLVAAFAAAMAVGGYAPGRRPLSAWLIAVCAVLLLVAIWQAVGTWRAARRYIANGGSVAWAAASRFTCIVALLAYVGVVVNEWQLIRDSWLIVTFRSKTPPSRIRVLNNRKEVEIAGGLSIGTAEALEAILDRTATIHIVHLNNDGGVVNEGVRLGELIKSRGVATFTARTCVSACLLAFMGGKERYLGTEGRLGLHEATVFGIGGNFARDTNERVRRVLLQRGLPESFINRALSTPASSMWYPSMRELLDAHVITSVVDERAYATTGISDWRDRTALETAFATASASSPVMVALKRYDPATYQSLSNTFVSSIQEGVPQIEMVEKLGSLATGVVTKRYLAHAPDQPLVSYYVTQTRVLRALRARNPIACVAAAYPEVEKEAPDFYKSVPRELRDEDSRNLSTLIEAVSTHPAAVPENTVIQGDLDAVFLGAERRVPKALKLISSPEHSVQRPGELCDATLALFDEIVSLSPQKAGPLLRFLAAQS
jgi:hypothetical protein